VVRVSGEPERSEASKRRAGRRRATDGGTEPVADDRDAGHGDSSADEPADDGSVTDAGSAPDAGPTVDSESDTERGDAVGDDPDHRSRVAGPGLRTDADDEAAFETGSSSVGVALTVGASLVTVLPLAVAPVGAVFGAAGLVVLGLAVRFDEDRALGLGVFGLLGGVLLGGATGASPLAVLVATAGALLAWDVADRALVVGEQLGRAAPTARLELVRATASASLLALGAGVTYAVYELAGGGKPMLALALLVLGATLLAAALR
jgi:hypothetical protein